MCGMPVCEWTQREPTLDIRFMGEDYDPGRSGRNREKDSKAKANGTDERRREKAGRTEQMPRNEMRCLISPGQARSYPWSVWSDVEPLKAPPAAQGIHYSHTYWKRRNTLESMYLFVTPLSARSTSPSYKNLSVLCREYTPPTQTYPLCPKVSLRDTRFNSKPLLSLQMPARFSFLLF